MKAELQNDVIVCRKLFEAAVTASNTRGLDESQIKVFAKAIFTDTTSHTLIEKVSGLGGKGKDRLIQKHTNRHTK